ncbi:membrane protein [Beggiatoa sp. PS]|nr:membrane protein [Beggiatoa sp. PS]
MKLFINQKIFLLFKQLLTIGTVLVILVAIIGHIVRDRHIVLALMMYIPLLPLGLWTILLDLWQGGHSLPKLRFSLTIIGLIITIWGSYSMIGTGNNSAKITANTISLLHWNVKWGGIGYNGHLTSQYTGDEWPSIREDIFQHYPDIIVLNEPPQIDSWLAQLTQQMGPNWSMFKYYRTERNGLAIFSLGKLQFERLVKIRNGLAMLVKVTVREQALRLLLVDGERSVRKVRTPLLTDIIKAVIDSDRQGQPIDMIVGDFNAVSRSIGFDSYTIAAGGYQLASRNARVWRGTWAFFLPLYDIDHIWIHKRFEIIQLKMLMNLNTDHRGQLVYFQNNR